MMWAARRSEKVFRRAISAKSSPPSTNLSGTQGRNVLSHQIVEVGVCVELEQLHDVRMVLLITGNGQQALAEFGFLAETRPLARG